MLWVMFLLLYGAGLLALAAREHGVGILCIAAALPWVALLRLHPEFPLFTRHLVVAVLCLGAAAASGLELLILLTSAIATIFFLLTFAEIAE